MMSSAGKALFADLSGYLFFTIFSTSSFVVMPVEMWTMPLYSSLSTFCISQCWFDGEPTLINGGVKDAISFADVVSQTEQEYSNPISSQCFWSSLCCSTSSSKNSRCAPYVSP